MMRAAAILVGVLAFASIAYCVYYYRVELGLVSQQNQSKSPVQESATTAESPPDPVSASQNTLSQSPSWQTINRPLDGFRVDLPSGAVQTEAPAYTSRGAVERVEMLQASSSSESSFAVSWSQNPPIARASRNTHQQSPDRDQDRIQDRILDLALNGALTRTHTTLISQSRSKFSSYQARDFAARGDGGVMIARLILAGNRLFLLIASFPSQSAQHDTEVNRFFNSFALTAPAHPN